MPHPRDLPECGEDLSQPLRPVGHHDHALARVAARAPQIIALVSADVAAFWNAVLRPEKIDGAGLPLVLPEDSGLGAHVWWQAVVCTGNRGRHLFPAKLDGEQLRQRSEPVIFDAWLP
jgi:hypothetical protein